MPAENAREGLGYQTLNSFETHPNEFNAKIERVTTMGKRPIELGIALMLLTACGATKAHGPDIRVENVWGRPSPQMTEAGAVYMVIKNDGDQDDKLIAAKTDVCEVVELHQSMLEGDVMSMHPVEGGVIEIPAGGSVELKPGGLHLMLIRLKSPLEQGASIALTLVFEKSGQVGVNAEIREP